MWKLQNLAVHVDFQRRGIATMLIQWGKEQAERERCPIVLQSSLRARGTYIKNGCRKYAEIPMEGFPVEDMVFIWEPKGLEGAWGTLEEGPRGGEANNA